MANAALKTRPAPKAVKASAPACETTRILRELAEECREYERMRAAKRDGDGYTDDYLKRSDVLMKSASLSVPRSELGYAFLQLTLYVNAFTLDLDLFMPDRIRKFEPKIYASVQQREDLRLAAALQLARRAVEAHDDPDLQVVAKHYMPVSTTERRDLLKACGVAEWRRA